MRFVSSLLLILSRPMRENHNLSKKPFRLVRHLTLAYKLHEPEGTEKPFKSPLIMLHGLFGSKKNTFSINKSVVQWISFCQSRWWICQNFFPRFTKTSLRNCLEAFSRYTKDLISWGPIRTCAIMAIPLTTRFTHILLWPLMWRNLLDIIVFRPQFWLVIRCLWAHEICIQKWLISFKGSEGFHDHCP